MKRPEEEVIFVVGPDLPDMGQPEDIELILAGPRG
jgi:hypothetical protein